MLNYQVVLRVSLFNCFCGILNLPLKTSNETLHFLFTSCDCMFVPETSPWVALGVLLGRLGVLPGRPGSLLGRSWGLVGCSWVALGRSWGVLGSPLGLLGSPLGPLGVLLVALGRSWGVSKVENVRCSLPWAPLVELQRRFPFSAAQV